MTEPSTKRWWKCAVLRGEGIPADLDGRWYDVDAMNERLPGRWGGLTVEATNQWEQRDDGAVAVVYRVRGSVVQVCHLARGDGKIACGAKYPALLAADHPSNVTCPACRERGGLP
jgi:hypothetical protein